MNAVTTYKNRTVEDAPEYSGAYKTADYSGVAWHVIGWELTPLTTWCCCDCDASGYERPGGGGAITEKGSPDCDHEHISYSNEPDYERTGSLVCVMIGDDRPFTYEPEDLTAIDDNEYCAGCGQIGCGC